MVIWGGRNKDGPVKGGARYNPARDSWSAMSSENNPQPRFNQTMIWTGKKAILWGGFSPDPKTTLIQGAEYEPTQNRWTMISTLNAPVMRENHSAVWTGKEMIIWGGNTGDTNWNTGSRYHPKSDTWIPISTLLAPSARKFHTAIWTGHGMIVWGGEGDAGNSMDSAIYDPTTDMWKKINTDDAPECRMNHVSVWTDHELFVFGGLGADGNILQDFWSKQLPSCIEGSRNR